MVVVRSICVAGLLVVGTACSAYDPTLIGDAPSNPLTRTDGGTSERDGGGAARSCVGAGHLSPCAANNADAVCIEGECQVVRCHEGFVDCDGQEDNGCEATLDSTEHCGACGSQCALAQVARHVCEQRDGQGVCAIDKHCPSGSGACGQRDSLAGCESGFGDCDGNSDNGCETRLDTLGNCGGCGVSCAVSDAQAACQGGSCVVTGCAPGSDDCDGQGCQRLTESAANCGQCGTACEGDAPNCAGGRCTSLDCEGGSADCDSNPENGCETDLASLEHCGGCGLACEALAHAQVGCEAGVCLIKACDDGFADCDANPENGCETDLSEPTSCGACNTRCAALPNVDQAECSATGCSILSCKTGFGDCDESSENGCEQSLNTLAHCGECGQACAPPHATGECREGGCTIAECDEGMDECNGRVEDGCEADLGSTSHCGGCGIECPSGAECSGGGCGCVTDADCERGLTCCDGSCIDTDSHCLWWPCIPGTSRDRRHCGACNDTCFRYACCAG